jgi:hypothetical protein
MVESKNELANKHLLGDDVASLPAEGEWEPFV